jgi:hypothetical protein
MGSHFFKSKSGLSGGAGTNMGLESRALTSGAYAARAASAAAGKDLGAADGFAKSKPKPTKGSSAYAKGPKV